jgi:replication fork protection complex subunit Tof1/Swi1
VKPDNDERRTAMFKDNKLRLLLTLLGFLRLGDEDDPEASWIIPSSLASEALREGLKMIQAFEFDPPTYDEGKSAEDYIRRKQRVQYDDDTEGTSGDEVLLFPPGGPTARKPDEQDGEQPKRRRRLQRREQELDNEELEDRRRKRDEAQKEKLRKIKSAMYVDSDDDKSDDERDREFFEREEKMRKATSDNILKALSAAEVNSKKPRKRKSTNPENESRKKSKVMSNEENDGSSSGSSSDDDEDGENVAKRSSPVQITLSDDESDAEMTDTPLSSPHTDQSKMAESGETMGRSRTGTLAAKHLAKEVNVESDEEDIPVQPQRRKGGFIIDSDSE